MRKRELRRGRQGRALAGAVLVMAVGLTGCGETHGTGSVGSGANTTAATESGYHNMETLSAGLKEKLEERLKKVESEGGSAETVSNVTCVSTGKLSAECHTSYSGSRPEESLEVTISEDGTTFITH